jgi:hypothetical protein
MATNHLTTSSPSILLYKKLIAVFHQNPSTVLYKPFFGYSAIALLTSSALDFNLSFFAFFPGRTQQKGHHHWAAYHIIGGTQKWLALRLHHFGISISISISISIISVCLNTLHHPLIRFRL